MDGPARTVSGGAHPLRGDRCPSKRSEIGGICLQDHYWEGGSKRRQGNMALCLQTKVRCWIILGDFRYTTPNTLEGFGGNTLRKQLFQPGGKIAKNIEGTYLQKK